MTVKTVDPHKSSLGMDANIAVLIAYLGGVIVAWIPIISYVAWLVPLIVYLLEKESSFVRFHSMQGFILNLVGFVFGMIILLITWIIAFIGISSAYAGLGFLGLISTLTIIISIVILVFAIIAIINGFQYKEYHIPIVGNIADSVLAKYNQ